MHLIVGLGNPGKEYENTRHNTGFIAVDFLAEHFEFEAFQKSEKHKAKLTEGEIAEEKVMMVKPQTYMNLSGQSVQSIVQFYKIPTSNIVAIYDDADLPLGTFRIRPSGSSGGHKGVQSIIGQLGDEFIRIRIGIQSEKPFPGELEDYVLGKLKGKEKKALEKVIQKLPEVITCLIRDGLEKARQQFN